MGFFSNIVGAAVKVAVTPITVVQDVAATVSGEEPDNTKNMIISAGEDLKDAVDDLFDCDYD